MKIASFNINNVNRRLPNLLSWLDAAKPDAVCLQELKAEDGPFRKSPCGMRGIARSGRASGRGTAWLSSPGVRNPS
jgi:exonuclease III